MFLCIFSAPSSLAFPVCRGIMNNCPCLLRFIPFLTPRFWQVFITWINLSIIWIMFLPFMWVKLIAPKDNMQRQFVPVLQLSYFSVNIISFFFCYYTIHSGTNIEFFSLSIYFQMFLFCSVHVFIFCLNSESTLSFSMKIEFTRE